MLPAHDGAHEGQAYLRRLQPPVSMARPLRPALCGRLARFGTLARTARPVADPGAPRGDRAARHGRRRGGRMKVGLWKIAHARSGDKADRADIGLFAYDAPTYDVLRGEVTRERVAQHFAGICSGPVDIYPLDNLLALKIVLNNALQGGAARSLRDRKS